MKESSMVDHELDQGYMKNLCNASTWLIYGSNVAVRKVIETVINEQILFTQGKVLATEENFIV